MVSRRFRHLPVISSVDDYGPDDYSSEYSGAANSTATTGGGTTTNVVGLLDITKCVFERLHDLERKVNEDANIVAAMEALERRGNIERDHVEQMKAAHGCPELSVILSKEGGDAVPEVSVKASVRDAAKVMKEFHQTAILIVSAMDGDDKLGGIFTTKDIVLRVIAAGLDPNTTSVVRVMVSLCFFLIFIFMFLILFYFGLFYLKKYFFYNRLLIQMLFRQIRQSWKL
jgi:hypothetical protein